MDIFERATIVREEALRNTNPWSGTPQFLYIWQEFKNLKDKRE